MKKVLSMLLFAVATLATSCDAIDDLGDQAGDALGDALGELLGNETDGKVAYEGGIVVSDSFTNDATFYVGQEDGTISIVMKEIQFASGMPTMDITLNDLAVTDGKFETATASTSVVMYNTVIDASAYPVTNVSGTYNSSLLEFEFECTANGKSYTVEFSGESSEGASSLE